MEDNYNHYITVDEEGRILDGFSDAFQHAEDHHICIRNDGGYQFRLFPDGEENPRMLTEDGIPLYGWTGTKVFERSTEDIGADRSLIVPEPTVDDRIRVLEGQNEMLLQCLLEMSEMVYA